MAKRKLVVVKPIELDILNNKVALDEVCWACDGSGKPIGEDKWLSGYDGKCSICGGKGSQLTDNGQAILEFINKYGGK